MDERVKRALKQWPNVPDAYDWLSLDRRGRWRLRGETISNRNLIDFINRNYGQLDDGSYAFQNGPQRVHVDLEFLPFVADVASDSGEDLQLRLHTGVRVADIAAAYLSSESDLILQTAPGPVLLRESALPDMLPYFTDAQGRPLPDAALAEALDDPQDHGLTLRLSQEHSLPVRSLDSREMERILGFLRHPPR